jgi:hypothetical protein
MRSHAVSTFDIASRLPAMESNMRILPGLTGGGQSGPRPQQATSIRPASTKRNDRTAA